jgi:hypothetical protein
VRDSEAAQEAFIKELGLTLYNDFKDYLFIDVLQELA